MDRNEILRYLGASGENEALSAMIAKAEDEVLRAAAPKSVSRLFPILVENNTVTISGHTIESSALADHLRGCKEAFLFAFTLGPGVDALIRRCELTDLPLTPVLQAAAAAYTEESADLAQEELANLARARGKYLRPRFSPGYEDFSLEEQKLLFDLLDIPKKIGVTLTESCLMIPIKSITAVIGLSDDPSLCHIGKCMSCTAEICPFRKEPRT